MDRKTLAARPLTSFTPKEMAKLYKDFGFTPEAETPYGTHCCPLGVLYALETGKRMFDGRGCYPCSLDRHSSREQRGKFGDGFDAGFRGDPLSFNEGPIDLKEHRKTGYEIGKHLRALKDQGFFEARE